MFIEDDVTRFYHYLGHHPDEWTEIRAIEWTPDAKGQIERTWVNNEKDFIDFCRKWNQKRHLYAGVNPRNKQAGTTQDVSRVTGIPFDIDSQREKGYEKDAATDQEVTEAYKQLEQMLKLIKEKGYDEPYIDFSGNGFRVIQKVDMPINDHKKADEKLKAYFMEYKIHISTLDSIYDIPRIIKVPGTWSIKGQNTEERPHRLAKIRNIGTTEPDQKLKQHIYEIKIHDQTNPDEIEETTDITEETLRKLAQAQKNKDIMDLYNGDWEKYGEGKSKWSRSEAEASLVYRLFFYGLSPHEVSHVMQSCKIGKWQESNESYKQITINKAYKAYLENPYRFFEGIKFVASKLSEDIQQDTLFIATDEKSDLRNYNPKIGIWEPCGKEKLQTITINKLKNLWQSYHTSETEKHIRYSNYVDIEKLGGPINRVIVKNGVYNLETKQLEPFNPELYAITALPIIYNIDATCPKIMKFLEEVVDQENIQKILEIIGYCLYKGYPLARIFILTGTGRNGKSVLISLITNFLGSTNTSSVDIQNLTDDSFRSAELFGKLANINGDLPPKPIKDTGLIKKCTGQDPLTVAKKYQQPFQFYNYAKLIFAANQVPRSYDNSDAMHRRLDIIEFPNKFDPDDPKTDPNLIEKLVTEQELSGLLNKALEALDTLLERGKFTNEGTIDERRVDYIKRSDPAHYFGITYMVQNTSPENYITKSQLYDNYVFMCRALDVIPTSPNWFSQNIKRYVTYLDEGWVDKDRVWRGASVDLDNLNKLSSNIVGNTVGDIVGGGRKKKKGSQRELIFGEDDDDIVGDSGKLPIKTNDTNATNAISLIVNISEKEEKIDNTTSRKQIIENTVGIVGEKRVNMASKRGECLNCVRSGLDTVEKIAEKMGISREGVEGLLKVLKRDKLIYNLRPGVWGVV